MMRTPLSFSMRRHQFHALSVFALIILVSEIGYHRYKKDSLSHQSAILFSPTKNDSHKKLVDFDPNLLSAKDWQQLGFSPKQAETILKYKEKILGGYFTTKEQIAKCYVISDEKFKEIEPYIRFSSRNIPAGFKQVDKFSKDLNVTYKFNPDHLSPNDWIQMGFSPKQAEVIIKYKQMLGGSFQSKQQFRECFVISDEAYRQLAPFLILPEGKSQVGSTLALRPFNPDHLSVAQWQKLGFSAKQAEVIVNYKKMLGGSFQSKQKFKECFVISDKKYKELEPYLVFSPSSPTTDAGMAAATPVRQPFDPNDLSKEGWMNWGFSEKQAESILKFKSKFPNGRFATAEEVKRSFVISEKKYNEMLPWIQFHTKVPPKSSVTVQNIELNTITKEQLVAFGFPPKVAAGFVAYRTALGGFAQKEQIFEVYDIEQNLAKKLLEATPLDASKVHKLNVVTTDEALLRKHPYFKYHADKIAYFRITYPNTDKILRKINVKPEQLKKMKWYLE